MPPPGLSVAAVSQSSLWSERDPPALPCPREALPATHMPPMVTVAQVRSEKAGAVSVALLAGRM